MKYNVIVSDKAAADIDEIADGILQISRSVDVTRKFINAIYDRIDKLDEFPNGGSNPRNHALLSLGYKFVVYEQYLIFYRISENNVYVASVFNAKMDYFRYYRF